MPEGHTVHRLARAFEALFLGETLSVTSPQGRFEQGAGLLDGRRLVAAVAHGKQLFLGFAPARAAGGDHATGVRDATGGGSATNPGDVHDALWLRVHLGLYGSWTFAGDGSAPVVHAIGAPRRRVGERETVLQDAGTDADATPASESPADAAEPAGPAAFVPPAPRGAVRVRLLGSRAVADLTGPTACEVLTLEQRHEVEARLGPDPLQAAAAIDRSRFADAVARSRSPIGLLLMNQEVVAGVGNIFRAEALYRAGLDPFTPGREVPAGTVKALWADLVTIMADAVARGSIVTTRPEHRDRPPGRGGAVASADAFYVYHRAGRPCRVCGEPVATRVMAGRNLFWCPRCQLRPEG